MKPPSIAWFAMMALLLPIIAQAAEQPTQTVPDFVGSMRCADCHEAAMAEWRGSHHDWAWREPTEQSVMADPARGDFVHKGVKTRLAKRNGRFFVETDGPDGKQTEYEVKYAVGIDPLQQYLVETAEGRLQALDTAWDVKRQRWYHLYPDQDLKGGNGLHWTGPYKSWNARCAECHATGFEKNYDPRSRSYQSRQAEIGVTCEACHGPGEAHLAWTKDTTSFDAEQWQGVNATGLTIGFDSGNARQEIELCAGCHSRREPLGDSSALPGSSFHDAYRLALLREGLYHADGSIQDEVYVYGSFLQSRMYARGVSCSNCHEPHSAGLRAEGNAVCTQCHSAAGNDDFPTLRQATYDDPSHHFHKAGSSGAECKSCHMIERAYMGIDGRRDHSFRVPRPDLSAETEAPNACTDCHGDRDAAWAGEKIARHFPESSRRGPHFSQVFAAARKDPAGAFESLLSLAENGELPGIVRASALDLMRTAADPETAARVAVFIGDEDPLVRQAAVALQRGAMAQERLQRLLPALEDPLRAVRLSAARELLSIAPQELPPGDGAALQDGLAEWRASLFAKADFPETQMAIGGAALTLRNLRAAEYAFREAVSFDPQLEPAWNMIVRLRASAGDVAGARRALADALAANPENDSLLQLRRAFGQSNEP